MLTVQGRVRKADSSCSSMFLGNPPSSRQTSRHFRRSTPTRHNHDTHLCSPSWPLPPPLPPRPKPGWPASTTPSSPPSAPTCPRARSRSWRCFRTAARPATVPPTMKKLKAALPANAQLVYLPASWNKAEDWPMFQRAYLTAQSLGVADKAHEPMYQAIWTTGELGVTEPSRTTQEKSADHRRCRAFLRARRGRQGSRFRQRLEVLQRGSQDAPGRQPDHRHAGVRHADARGQRQIPREQREPADRTIR